MGSAAKIASSHARPAITTSAPASSARMKGSVPIWATMGPQRSMISFVSVPGGPMLSNGALAMRRLRSFLSSSALMTARRNLSPCSRASSCTSSTACASDALQPLVSAEPISSGIRRARAPRSMNDMSWRYVASGRNGSPVPW
jgi:hypothetical protein